ncbi:MAG: Ku protein [Ilumatobacter sp.]|jgi:DNA end-binding protein Ku|uniref:non-homologous end joining protein Ku n=1 Tax=Ilumatobacter sp. TaxID=1967498 RepID=UPI00391AA78E
MARPIWTGSVAFGLVNVPVRLFTATQDRSIQFHQFQQGTSSRIRYRRVNEDTDEEVPLHDIVKGYGLDSGDYVMVTSEELEAVEPGRSRTIEITDFVDAAEIDPIYYRKTYYLAPRDETAARAYQLLVRAMSHTERTAVATMVMRSKQYLAAIRPVGDVLALETLFFDEEVRDPQQEIESLPTAIELSQRDLSAATTLIDAMTTEWEPSNYRDTYRERVLELIHAKQEGDEVVAAPEAEGAEVIELMSALEKSVEAARNRRPGNAHQAQPVRPAGDVSDDAPVVADLRGLSKSELYDLAQELDIAGRSSMDKQELANAISVERATPRAS